MADEQPGQLGGESFGRDFGREARILSDMLSALQELSSEGREHILKTVATFFGVSIGSGTPRTDRSTVATSVAAFSEDRSPTPKQFMLEKRPFTDVERVTALAYYLTHYRNQPHFRTLDLSQLNTEAAQIKLSNPSKAVDNAVRAGLISQATKGARQLSAAGELYVQALPDRDAARESIKHVRPRRRRRSGPQVGASSESDES
jgi:hypothetical protein